MSLIQILAYPIDKMIFKYPFDQLVQEVWGKKFMNVRLRKSMGKWLGRQFEPKDNILEANNIPQYHA
jgi:hypothetical protein